MSQTLVKWNVVKTLPPKEGEQVIVIAPDGQEVVMYRTGSLYMFAGESFYPYWTPIFWRPL